MSETDPVNAWLRRVQGVAADTPIGDPSRTADLGELVQGQLSRLPFEMEQANYVRLLHELAPAALKEDIPGE